MHVASLLDAATARGFTPATVAMDMGYDNNRVYAECAERDCAAIVPLRRGQKERDLRIPRIEARLRPRVPPGARHRARPAPRHLVVLARLALVLERARAVPLAA